MVKPVQTRGGLRGFFLKEDPLTRHVHPKLIGPYSYREREREKVCEDERVDSLQMDYWMVTV